MISELPSKWSMKKIEQIGKVIGGGTPSTKNEFYYGGNIPWITPKDLSKYNFMFIDRGERNITKLGLENSSTRLMPEGTVLFSSRAPIGYVAIAKNEISTNQGFKSIVCNEKIVDNKFIYYSLKFYKEAIENIAAGSTFKEVSGKVLKEFEIPIPPLKEQNAISKVLFSLDSKIELNQKMNQTLEKIGQTIFKHWFIDFEFPDENGNPYKSSGGEMVDSELGEIPKGWKVGKFKDVAEITMGQSPKSEFYNEDGEGLPFHQGVTNFGERFPKNKMYCTVENKIAEKGDILFSVRAPVGRINIANSKMVIGRGLCAIRHKNNLQSFILYQLKNIFAEEDSIGSGTVFNAITRKDLDDLLVLIPNLNINSKFNSLVGSFDNEIKNLTLQNDNLSQIRDSLLPKLMSGKIRLNKPVNSNQQLSKEA